MKEEKVSVNFTLAQLDIIDRAAAKVFLDRGIWSRQTMLREAHAVLGLPPPGKPEK